MLTIIWYHIKACVSDIRATRHGNLEVYTRPGRTGQLFVGDGRREWRMR